MKANNGEPVKKRDVFNVQAFLDAAGVARTIQIFQPKATIFFRGMSVRM